MKRKYIIALLLTLCSVMGYAQENQFEKLAEMEGITSVYISKTMLSLMPDMQTNGLDVGKMAGKLDNIRILTCEKASVMEKFKKEIAFINSKNGYEELMRVNEEGEWVTMFLKELKSGKKEFVLRVEEKDGLVLIVITGNLTPQEIQSIMNQ